MINIFGNTYIFKFLEFEIIILVSLSGHEFLLVVLEEVRELQKNIYFCFIDYGKAFNCVDHNKVWKILKEMGIQDHLTCLLRNLYAGQEATVRTGHGTTDWFQIGKVVRQGCILSASFEKTLMLGKIEGRRRRG